MKDYELIEHTADIGVRVSGSDLKQIFVKAALAMFDIIAEPCKSCDSIKLNKFDIKIEGQDREELLVNWLNELLSLFDAKEVLFKEFKIDTLSETGLVAIIFGCPRENCKIKAEIKAATYHELKIEKIDNGFVAQVIFDV
ncbi:MAG: archease [Candidatus Omnitrophica bacterium]|nr:archease [Candidatus Omnitrophota bacterium]HOX55159.1 archease [Candidatus Omnitrophota bacterium]